MDLIKSFKMEPLPWSLYAVIESLAKITAMGGDYRKVGLHSRSILKGWARIGENGANPLLHYWEPIW